MTLQRWSQDGAASGGGGGAVIPSMPIASFPPAASMSGQFVRASNVGVAPGALYFSDGTSYSLAQEHTLSASGAAGASSSSTSFASILTLSVPGGALGPNGVFRLAFILSRTNSAAEVAYRLLLGAAGQPLAECSELWFHTDANTDVLAASDVGFMNRGSMSSQVQTMRFYSPAPGGTTIPLVTASVNTAADFAVHFAVQTNGTDVAQLQRHRASIL